MKIRYTAVRNNPWGANAGEIRDPGINSRAWLATMENLDEAADAYDATAPTTPPHQRRRRA
ncbi:hypothetical protein Fmac_007717 [Flemingia macrophylla]|uniref:AP2/ERF domain-containing protein n=1 Tax=Flemingia macrophylla TaxID=520843 RepID=A0ABD1MVC7_9FABA